MTWKQAAADLPYGGGKAVIAVPEVPARGSDDAPGLLLRYAELVESLHGTYVTAADMNTGEADMDVVGERTSHVLGRSVANGGSGDPGAATARGVFHGIRGRRSATCSATTRWTARSVWCKGSVRSGAAWPSISTTPVRPCSSPTSTRERASALAEELGRKVVAPDDVIGTVCDVFAPCATGKVLTRGHDPAPALPRIVAGAANNQLGDPEDGERLRDAGILFAPDFVVNAGGVIHLAGRETLGWDEATMTKRLEAIGDTLLEIFERSRTRRDLARRRSRSHGPRSGRRRSRRVSTVEVRPLTAADAEACDAIVAGLPYHFGSEEGRRTCAAAVRRDPGLVAVEDARSLGFLTYVHRFDEAAEITWMAVRADRRRQGIGHALIDRLAEQLAAVGRQILLVLTVSPSDPGPEPDDGYQSTRAFYRSTGFVLATDLPREWDGGDTAVLLVRSLARGVTAGSGERLLPAGFGQAHQVQRA